MEMYSMYATVATRQFVAVGTDQFSQAVDLGNVNSIDVDVVVLAMSGTTPTLTVTLQIGNDLENWEDVSSPLSLSAIGADRE
jgi:hypothetical protein